MFALILLAIFGFVVVAWFRDAHQRSLWQPLDQLRCLAGEMRRGNLNATIDIPQNIELGSLFGGFLEMERELASVRDSVEQKVAERTARLKETQSELLQSAKLAPLGQLVSGVAHEINNPLTSILGFSEVLLNRPATDRSLQRPLRMIREEALRVRHLVSNLTSFARRSPSRMQRIDLRNLLTDLADLRHYQLLAKNIYLRLQPPAEPVWVLFDLSVELETPGTSAEIPPAPGPEVPPEKSETAPQDEVLVIDDERGILEMVSDAMERLHCRSTLLPGSADAPTAIEHGNFDLIHCDLKMPGQNWLDILRFTREKRPDLASRFLLMTGNLADTEKHAVELAGVAVLLKPFALARLRETVEILLPKKMPA